MSNNYSNNCKENQLIEASYKLTLAEQRLMLYCIDKLNSTKFSQSQILHVIDLKDEFSGLGGGSVFYHIKKAIDLLSERWIKVKKNDNVKEFRWIQSKEYSADECSVLITFSNDVIPFLCQLEQQFTKYKSRNVSGFKRIYSIRLYELLTKKRDMKKYSITVDEFRILLKLGNKFKTMVNLKSRVLDPAIEEINSKSDLLVTYTQTKKGRAVYSFEFTILLE